jgi:putative ABC transport system ATP-binding protein
MVTHEASAAATADRIVFLADGETVEDVHGLDEHDVLGTMERLAHR